MIVFTEPSDKKNASVVLAFSDAADNQHAINDIDEWARDHGFIRSLEYSLNVRQVVDGVRYYYSACYHVTA